MVDTKMMTASSDLLMNAFGAERGIIMIRCFFGRHLWEQYEDGWSLECSRCKRFLIPTPVGDLINVLWIKFWYAKLFNKEEL